MRLNKKFEKWRMRTESLPIDERLAFRIFSDGYLDGAKTEPEAVLTLINDVLVHYGADGHWPIAIDSYDQHDECVDCVRNEIAKEIKRRIKERDNG